MVQTETMNNIRRLRPGEGAALRAIRLQALADSPAAFGSTLDETEARPMAYWENRAVQNAAGEESIIVIAETEDGWIGLAGSYLDETEPGKSCDLISMWVHPAHRGQGVGKQLVESVVDWARERGLERVSLWVTESNASAIALYTRCGFMSTGETQPLPSNPALFEQRMVLDL